MIAAPSRCLIATSQTWPSTAVLPALLAQARATVTAFSPGPLGLSGHVTERLRGSRDPVVAAARLRDVVDRGRFDWVIVADEPLLQALLARPGPRDRAWLPVDPSDAGAVRLALSKHAFVERAASLGIRIPTSSFARSAAGALAQAAKIGYPVVLRGDGGFGGSHVRVCADARAARSAFEELATLGFPVVVQRFVSGFRVSACVLYERGVVAAYKAYRATCGHPDPHSASTVHEFFEDRSILDVATALGAATGFHGMAGIDFMSDGTDLYALEFNPRPTIGFGGTRANRAFFAPAIGRRLARDVPAAPQAYDGRVTPHCYFPGYAIYFVAGAERRNAVAWARLAASLREARLPDTALALWEIARSVYDAFARRSPRLHAIAQRARGSRAAGPDRARLRTARERARDGC